MAGLTPTASPPWLPRRLRPVVLCALVGCLALSVTQVLALLIPGLHTGIILAACVLAALESHFSHRLIHRRFLSGTDLWRFRAIEFGLYFVVLRVIYLALNGWPAELAGPGRWPADLRSLFDVLLDLETLLTLALAVLSALAVSDTLTDLDRVGEPPDHDRGYVSPLDSLTGRFFVGGAALLVLSGLAQIGLAEVLNLARPPVTGLVLNVLVYFLLGLLLLGQVRLGLLAARWQAQGVRMPADMPARWVRYSLLFIGLAAGLAFLLPTGYTIGALSVLGNLLILVTTIFWLILYVLLNLMLLPFVWLMSVMRGVPPQERPRFTPPPPLPTGPPMQMPPWVEALRPLLVWGLILAMVAYILINYVRERPELARALRQFGPLSALRRLWGLLRQRAAGLATALQASAPLAWLRQRLAARRAGRPFGYFRLGGAAPREQILYYYLSILRRAREQGVPRRPAQTPREYRPRLARHLPEAERDVAALTQAFEEARYGPGLASPEQAARAKTVWQRVRAALTRKEKERGKNPYG